MKKIALIITFLATSTALDITAKLHAQTAEQAYKLHWAQGAAGYEDMPVVADLRLFEVEMAAGVNFSRRWDDFRARTGTDFHIELRLNRPEPWDLGLQMKMSTFAHAASNRLKINTTIFAPSLFVDYNHRPSTRTRFFAGIGFGAMFSGNNAVVLLDPVNGFWINHNDRAFSVTPRVGISVFDFLRFTAEYSITSVDYQRFSLGIGFTFGGSYKSTHVDRRSKKQKFWEDTFPAIIGSFLP